MKYRNSQSPEVQGLIVDEKNWVNEATFNQQVKKVVAMLHPQSSSRSRSTLKHTGIALPQASRINEKKFI